MTNRKQADRVADLVRQFIDKNDLSRQDAEGIASKLISDILHWTMRSGEMDGDDGRKTALAAARRGLGDFVSDVHAVQNLPPPACYTLITIRTDDGLWVAETGYEEMVQ